MTKENKPFKSPLGPCMQDMLDEKREAGYKMNALCDTFHQMDRLFVENGLDTVGLPENIVRLWTTRKAHENAYNHSKRIALLRQLGDYLLDKGLPVHLPERPPSKRSHYAPYIFTRDQIRDILDAADSIQPHPLSPGRQVFLPLIFRILYCCGLRSGEALSLKLDDVDLENGVLTIREAKFRKERFVPMSESLGVRLEEYVKVTPFRQGVPFLFASKNRRPYARRALYTTFRRLLFKCGISHGGRGKGPRLHDFRHTFAVHRLENWYRQGGNLAKQLPVLSAYLGHTEISGTIEYLHITLSLLPDIATRMEESTGSVIPREDAK